MPCTLSTQKRAHLAHQAGPAAVTTYWSSSLPKDITIKLAERLVADNDIDSYLAFRVVCHNWRTETNDKPGKVDDHTDPTRFQPTKWALLDKQGDHIMFVDVNAGRFLHMSIPILQSYLLVGTTSGGLVLLGEKEEPHQTCLLNPFTGAIAHFKVRAPAEGVMTVAVTTKPLMVFVSLEDGDIIWADQSSEHFKRFNRLESDKPTPIVAFNGDVYASDPYGAIFTSTVDDVPDGKKCRSAVIIYMRATIPSHNNNASPDASPEALAGGGGRYYLVQSRGDLLLILAQDDYAPSRLQQSPLIKLLLGRKLVISCLSKVSLKAASVL
jgi:hypothetical protein